MQQPQQTIGNGIPEQLVVTIKAKGPKALVTTPMLGLLPTMTETQIEARFRGYAQGVRLEAAERAATCQRTAADKVGKAHSARTASIAAAQEERAAAEKSAEDKFREIVEEAKRKRQSRLAKAAHRFESVRDEVGKAFKGVVEPIEHQLGVELRAIAQDASNKIVLAGEEFAPMQEAAQDRRIAQEEATKKAAADEALEVHANGGTSEQVEAARQAVLSGKPVPVFSIPGLPASSPEVATSGLMVQA